jgi:hypothetical protein
MNRRHDDLPAIGIVFAIGVLFGALLTCIAVALTLPELLI